MKAAIPTLLLLSALAGVSVIWARQRQTTTELRRQITALRSENDRLPPLRSERRRLQQLQREVEQRNEANRPAPQREPVSRQPSESNTAFPFSLAVGEWLPHTAWKNRGRATPAAALETTLWAAAGGDLATLKNGFLLDEAVRTETEAIRSKLPARAQLLYTSPEELIAAVFSTAIPLGAIQVVWQEQSDPDNAAMRILLKKPELSTLPGATPTPDRVQKNLSAEPATSKAGMAGFNFRRSEEHGWQLIVPRTALAKLTRDFLPPATP